jgi:hypothetical protein
LFHYDECQVLFIVTPSVVATVNRLSAKTFLTKSHGARSNYLYSSVFSAPSLALNKDSIKIAKDGEDAKKDIFPSS